MMWRQFDQNFDEIVSLLHAT